MDPKEDIYCTLLMSDSYLPGAAVLSQSLRDAGTTKKLACLVTLDTLSADTISELRVLYDYLLPVERISNPHPTNLYSMQRPDLLFAFTKIALWRQTQFRKIVYIDADIVALRAPDELFDIAAPFAAAPDIGWPDAFNSGVMVIAPNMGDFWALQTLAVGGDSFDGADQGLLNQYYEHRGWHRISFTYNCTPNAEYQWEPAYRYYKSRITMIHFIGVEKPWIKGRHAKGPGVYSDLLSQWWAVHDRHIKPVSEHFSISRAAAGYEENEAHAAQAAEHQYSSSPTAHSTSLTETRSDPSLRGENLDQEITQPASTAERKFSAPHAEWDATRYAPPQTAKPEAENFPSQTYEFSQSRELFHAPSTYPEPPKDMWYEVPAAQPTSRVVPKPIFPWERERPARKPARIFAEDSAAPEPEAVSTTTPEPTPTRDEEDSRSTTPPPREITQEDPSGQEPFAPTKNAWDNVAGIERYVRAVLGAQNKVKSRAPPISADILAGMGFSSPGEDDQPGLQTDRAKRRESLILTDFPSAFDRPSLPVTPAAIKRTTFWGGNEGDSIREDAKDESALPTAEGVPDQADWDPAKQLESLRRASLDEFAQLSSHFSQAGGGQPNAIASQPLPSRGMPAHSTVTPPPEAGLPIHAPKPTKPALKQPLASSALPEGVLASD